MSWHYSGFIAFEAQGFNSSTTADKGYMLSWLFSHTCTCMYIIQLHAHARQGSDEKLTSREAHMLIDTDDMN